MIISQNQALNINVTWQTFGSKITRETTHKHIQNVQINKKLAHIIFYQFWACKISQNSQNRSNIHSNFFEIFVKKLKRTRDPSSKNRGEYSKNQEEPERNPKTQRYPAQTHAGEWIRISRTPLRCWIDPDPLGSRSNGPKRGALDRVRTHPVQRLI